MYRRCVAMHRNENLCVELSAAPERRLLGLLFFFCSLPFKLFTRRFSSVLSDSIFCSSVVSYFSGRLDEHAIRVKAMKNSLSNHFYRPHAHQVLTHQPTPHNGNAFFIKSPMKLFSKFSKHDTSQRHERMDGQTDDLHFAVRYRAV